MSYVTHADLGGQAGYGRVVPEPEGDPFHAPWEARAMALTLAMGATGTWNIDMSRAARETLLDYAELDYWRIWLAALEKMLVEHGLASAGEIASASCRGRPRPSNACCISRTSPPCSHGAHRRFDPPSRRRDSRSASASASARICRTTTRVCPVMREAVSPR